MNYEEKYKQAFERAKGMWEQGMMPEIVEYIFPELQEDNDDRIRKSIMNLVKKSIEQGAYALQKWEADDMLAWLEKQGKPSDDELTWLKTFIEEEAYYLSMDIRDEVDREKLIKLQNALAWLEKQGEQKPVDNVEPKFKVRDWLQYRDAEPFLVEEITKQGYCNGNSCLPFEWEDEIHPWTIQDAKNGDIVYFECHGNKHLFIVKSVGETKDHVEGHFWYDITRNEFEVWDGRLPYSNIASMCDAIPATKEQRNLLFAKMKDAGYEWDAKNKTLWQNKMTRQEQIKQASYAAYYDPYDPEGKAKQDAFENGARWADRTMIERACQWLKTAIYLDYENSIEHRYETMEELINDFKKAMQDENN